MRKSHRQLDERPASLGELDGVDVAEAAGPHDPAVEDLWSQAICPQNMLRNHKQRQIACVSTSNLSKMCSEITKATVDCDGSLRGTGDLPLHEQCQLVCIRRLPRHQARLPKASVTTSNLSERRSIERRNALMYTITSNCRVFVNLHQRRVDRLMGAALW